MLKVRHRINTIEDLRTVSPEYGIELDVRYHENDLVLHHDPLNHHLNNPTKFEDLLKEYHHSLLILNIKTEGIEEQCIELMNKYDIKDWFFLDMSMPFFVKYAKYKDLPKENLCVRFSEYEAIEYALEFKDCVSWVWVDCFNDKPMTDDEYEKLHEHFKICLVSPELQGHPLDSIQIFKDAYKNKKIEAVCTKRPELWD